MNPFESFFNMAFRAGGIDMPRVRSCAALAIRNGDKPEYVLDCLLRNQPRLFSPTLARKRQQSNGVAGGRFSAGTF